MLDIITVVAAASSMYGVSLDHRQVECMATAIYHEARGEPLVGQIGVAHVIMNRVKSNRHPNSVCEAVYKPHQFTNIKNARPDKDSKAWAKAVKLSSLIQAGQISDPTLGSTLYHNPITAPKPRWDFTKLRMVVNIDNHRYYKEV